MTLLYILPDKNTYYWILFHLQWWELKAPSKYRYCNHFKYETKQNQKPKWNKNTPCKFKKPLNIFMLICELYKLCYFYGSLINASHQHRELSKSSFHQLKIYTFPMKISKFKQQWFKNKNKNMCTCRKSHYIEYSVQLVMVIRITSFDVLLSTVKYWFWR